MSEHLRCEGIQVSFGGVVACNDISLTVEKGKIVGLIGPNGAGKTTLFNVLTRFQPYAAGSVFHNGENIDALRPHEMVHRGLARTFQNINLFKDQTTLRNIMTGGHSLMGDPIQAMFWTPSARQKEHEIEERALEIAETLNLTAELENEVGNLPYGYQKRVELGRALASKPSILLLDEPVAGCNDDETAELQEIIRKVNTELGVSVLLVEHDMKMVMKVCDYLYVINFGANLAEGTPEEIRKNPEVIKAYLGEEEHV
ncbi:ATP-binding cassette domain-containing protein [Anderseniella sp. Alg231-50]|uniref:ATP-binding cassette domain-containing protein n=1 Tax=Anderseniella sp. Alg231-50 TaxID=1922226 RepID=UPI000D55BF66